MTDPRDPLPHPDDLPADDLIDPLADYAADDANATTSNDQSPSPTPEATRPSSSSAEPEAAAQQKATKRLPPRAGTNALQKNTVLVIGGMVAVGILAVVALAVRNKSSPQTATVSLTSKIDTADDVDAKYKLFMAQMNAQMPQALELGKKNQEQVARLESTIGDALRRMEEDRARDSKRLDEALAKINDKADGLVGAKGGSATSAGDLDAFVAVLKTQRGKGTLSLDEARLRLETWLKNNGFSGSGLALLRDRALDQLGFLYVGDVAEPDLSAEELSRLPEMLRPLCKKLAEENYQNAAFSGRVLVRADEALTWLNRELGAQAQAVNDADKKSCIDLARVRKANVTKEQEEQLPDLIAKRDSQRILPTELFRLETFVYGLKKTIFPALTPGQHVSLVMALAGLRGNPNGQFQSNVRTPKAEDLQLVSAAARDATKVALGQGIQDQNELIVRARSAAHAKVSDLKLSIPNDQLEQLVLVGVADAVRGAANGPNPVLDALTQVQFPSTTGSASPGPSAPAPVKIPSLHHGPLDLSREDAPLAGSLLAAIVCDRLLLDPMTPEGAAVASALLTAAPDLATDTWTVVNAHDQRLSTWTTSLLTSFQKIAQDARAGGTAKLRLTTGDPTANAIAQAIDIGRTIGSNASSEAATIDKVVRKRLEELAHDGLSFQAPQSSARGWAGFLPWYAALGQSVANKKLTTVTTLFTLISQQMVERKVAHEQVSLPGLPATFRDRVVQELNDALPTSLPTLIAHQASSRLTADALRTVVVQGHNRFAMASAAEAVLTMRAQKLIAERFAQLIDDDKSLPALYEAIARWIPESIHATLESSKPDLGDSSIGPVAVDTAAAAADPLLSFLARTLIEINLEPRIRLAGGSLNPTAIDTAMNAIHTRLSTMEFVPFSLTRIDQATQELHQFGLAQLDLARNAPSGDTASSLSGTGPGRTSQLSGPGSGRTPTTRPSFWTIKDDGLPGLPIGQTTAQVQQGQVFGIPRGSAMQCYLEIGIDLPIKSQEAGQDLVQLRAVGGFFGPNGKWYAFPPCIMQGKAKPNPGADRNSVQITSITAIVGRKTLDREMSGVVTDERGGMNGMLALFDRHSEKVLPEAGLLALLEGAGQSLSTVNTSTTQIVPGSTTITQDPGNSFKTGIGKGVEKGVGLLEKYQESYIDKISPTMRTWNGQKLVAYFFSTVEFPDMTAAQWREFSSTSNGAYNGFK